MPNLEYSSSTSHSNSGNDFTSLWMSCTLSGVRTIGVEAIFLDELEQQVEKAKVSSRGVYPLIGGCVADSVGDRTRSHELEPFPHPTQGESSRPCL